MTDRHDDEPEFVLGDHDSTITTLLRELQRGVLLHPEASRAMFGALAAEGRAFAQTAEGRRWKERILRSALLQHLAPVWESATLWVLEDAEVSGTPSAIIDAVAAAAGSPRRDALMSTLFNDPELKST
jgi:hypothetical protein